MSDNSRPIIHVYSIMWNEEVLLPYFLRHYSQYADKIFIFDDNSTDKTAEIARAHEKVTLMQYPFSSTVFNDVDRATCFVESYKKYSRGVADWVICVDGDEFIYHRNIHENLHIQRGIGKRILVARGYAMLSNVLPTSTKHIYEELPYGIRERRYDKPVAFDPALDITFGPGRHTAYTTSDTRPVSGRLTLLHYRYLSRDYFIARSQHLYERMKLDEETQTRLMKGGLDFYDTYVNGLDVQHYKKIVQL